MKIIITLLVVTTIMANQWKAGNYMNSGLSKSQYTAKQSKPKSTSTKKWIPAQQAVKQSSTSFPIGAAPGYWQTVDNTPTDWASVQAKDKEYSRGGSASKPKSVNTTQRTQASNILAGGLFGTPSAGAQTNRPIPTSSTPTGILGKIFQAASAPVEGVYHNLMGKGMQDLGLSEYLGLTKQSPVMDFPIGENLTPQEQQQANQVISDGANQPYNDYTSPNAITAPYQPTGNGGVDFANTYNTSKRSSNRTPQPVSQPQPTSDISSIVKALIEYGQPQQDFTPTQSNQGTVQRPIGMGQFSSGQYANGAGGYVLGGGGMYGGSPTGGDQNFATDQQDILGMLSEAGKSMLGNTAQAEGFNAPNPYQQQNDYTNSPMYKNLMATLYPNGDYSQGNPAPQATPTGGSGGGGVAQNYAQATPQQQQQQAFDNSGYKAAQKAQKKALDELIKSIKSQYATSTTEGTKALDASKQQDLLKLSGLFNFGANQDPNSEQRIQYEQRSRNDYAGQLKDFLAKLAQGQSKDISGAKQGYQSSLADILQQQAQAQQAYQNQQSQQMSRARSGGGTAPTKAPSHQEIFDWVNGALQAGGSWQEIADQAVAQKIPTNTGSYFDQILNNANKQGAWR